MRPLSWAGRIGINPPTHLFRIWKRAAASNALLGFVDEVLRGLGQVMFQNSPLTGLLFLAGLFVGGWQFGAYGLLGTAAATLAARWFGVPGAAVGAGLYGYNGALVGVALAFYLADNTLLPFYVACGGVVSAIVAGAIGNILATWQVPALTGPFVVTAWFFTLGSYGLDQVGGAALYLLSDLSSGVTGEILHVDSGFHAIGIPKPENGENGG